MESFYFLIIFQGSSIPCVPSGENLFGHLLLNRSYWSEINQVVNVIECLPSEESFPTNIPQIEFEQAIEPRTACENLTVGELDLFPQCKPE